jgi:hypothetical protein
MVRRVRRMTADAEVVANISESTVGDATLAQARPIIGHRGVFFPCVRARVFHLL